MSKQLAISAAFSILMMAVYVLFGADSTREPLGSAADAGNPVQISVPALPEPSTLLPALH